MNSYECTPWASYDSESSKYFDEYSKLHFSDVHRQFVKFLPNRFGAKVLDIGCGSGRDALSLARRGYQVTAVDPSHKMLELASSKNNHRNIAWVNDRLPNLLGITDTGYDFALISAVWMHIPTNDRAMSLERLSDLLNTGGRLAITLRIGAPDPIRIMYPVSAEELLSQSAALDLHPIYESKETKDSFRRHQVTWRKFVFEKQTRY
ncbi:MAG: class I SAM-dependent methyltransferase [Proteobacteria bacterium]|nr:MAG: class I SAM-dependent methyltransferase [Pseudomonadota bacterium]